MSDTSVTRRGFIGAGAAAGAARSSSGWRTRGWTAATPRRPRIELGGDRRTLFVAVPDGRPGETAELWESRTSSR